MSEQEWLTEEGKNTLIKEKDALARRPWRSIPIILDDPRRAVYSGNKPADFCHLIKIYSSSQIDFLIDQAEKIEHLFFVEIGVPLNNRITMPQFISLHTTEVDYIRQNMMLNSSTGIVFDKYTMQAGIFDLESLLIRKTKADKLLINNLETEKLSPDITESLKRLQKSDKISVHQRR